jgi:hypothetical protein
LYRVCFAKLAQNALPASGSRRCFSRPNERARKSAMTISEFLAFRRLLQFLWGRARINDYSFGVIPIARSVFVKVLPAKFLSSPLVMHTTVAFLPLAIGRLFDWFFTSVSAPAAISSTNCLVCKPKHRINISSGVTFVLLNRVHASKPEFAHDWFNLSSEILPIDGFL